MKRKRHGPGQIIAKLREADAMLGTGSTIAQVCQRLEIVASGEPHLQIGKQTASDCFRDERRC